MKFTFFVVNANVSELVKSIVGAVSLLVVLSIYIKCTSPGNSSRYLLIVREVLVQIQNQALRTDTWKHFMQQYTISQKAKLLFKRNTLTFFLFKKFNVFLLKIITLCKKLEKLV